MADADILLEVRDLETYYALRQDVR